VIGIAAAVTLYTVFRLYSG